MRSLSSFLATKAQNQESVSSDKIQRRMTQTETISNDLPMVDLKHVKEFEEENQKKKENKKGNLYQSFQPFLFLGKCIGLIPIQGLFQKDIEALKFRKWSFVVLVNLMVCILMGGCSFVCLIGIAMFMTGKGSGHFAHMPAGLLFYAQGLFVYLYFLRKGEKFIEVFRKWDALAEKLEMTKPDLRLSRDVNLVAGFLMTSAIAENAISHFKLFQFDSDSDSFKANLNLNGFERISKSFDLYYHRGQSLWASLFPYNFPLALALFLSNKFAVLAWNYSDLLIIIFSRALHFKFRSLVEGGRAVLLGERTVKTHPNHVEKWRQLMEEYEILCKKLAKVNSFLSPLILLSFALNVYFVCIQIHLGVMKLTGKVKLSKATTTIESVYAVWSFLHLIVRIFLVSLSGSRVNEWGCKIEQVLKKCPNQLYTSEVKRTESFARANAFGLSGLEAFYVKKSLMLKIVGVLFTFVVFLLQTNFYQPLL